MNGSTLQQLESRSVLVSLSTNFLLGEIRQKVGCSTRIFKRIRPFVGLEHLINVYRSIAEPYFTYCCIVWDSIGETLVDSLQKLQNRAARVITGASYSKHSADIRHELVWLSHTAPNQLQSQGKASWGRGCVCFSRVISLSIYINQC